MKMLKLFLVAAVCFGMAGTAISQKTKTESFKVSGECGTCKKKIEKSAKEAGATYAAWDQQTKILKVSYSAGIDVAAIQKKIADAGYDTPNFRATDESYNSLDKCCQYERQSVKDQANCCSTKDCKMKEGKCADMANCKDKASCKDNADCSKKACCDKSEAADKNDSSEKGKQ